MPSKLRSESPEPDEPDTSIDPYQVLQVSQDATEDDIKKAYRKAALKHHPDKATGTNVTTAKEDFQRIAFAYAILSDPRRRSRYDATGSTSEVLLDADDDFDWLSFYRTQFSAAVTDEVITSFSSKYKGSDEEKADVLKGYMQFKGKLDKVYQVVMLSNVLEDDSRFRQIIDDAIEAGEVESYDAYTKESAKSKAARIKRAQKEAEEAAEAAEDMNTKNKSRAKGGKKASSQGKHDDLLAMIQARQKERGATFLDNLEAKYAEGNQSKGKKRGGAKAMDEPPEEAFEAMAKRIKKSVA